MAYVTLYMPSPSGMPLPSGVLQRHSNLPIPCSGWQSSECAATCSKSRCGETDCISTILGLKGLTIKVREPSEQHHFDVDCEAFGIEHRLCPLRHPKTIAALVERFDDRVSGLANSTQVGCRARGRAYCVLQDLKQPHPATLARPPITCARCSGLAGLQAEFDHAGRIKTGGACHLATQVSLN